MYNECFLRKEAAVCIMCIHAALFSPCHTRHPAPSAPVHADILTASAKEAAGMLEDARLLLARLSASKELARSILTAAQSSDTAAVKRLIKQTGDQK